MGSGLPCAAVETRRLRRTFLDRSRIRLTTRSGKMSQQPGLGLPLELQLSNFENTELDRVVELISGPLVSQARKTALDFNPKPFIRAFESAAEQLENQRRSASAHVSKVEGQVRSESTIHSADVDRQQRSVQEFFRLFEELDNRLNEVSNAAIRIGEQLESLDRTRLRAQELQDVVNVFEEAENGDVDRVESLRPSGPNGEKEASVALLVRRLTVLSRELDVGDMDAKSTLERYHERMERFGLDAFERAYRIGDIAAMASCARTLIALNSGNSCVQAYVSQHEFFREHLNQSTFPLAPARTSESQCRVLSRPRTSIAVDDSRLTSSDLYDEVEQIFVHEFDVIATVFPDPIPVVTALLQRIFAQTIQEHLEAVLASSASARSFLKSLASSFEATQALVANLERFIKTLEITPSSSSALIQLVKQCSEDLFVPYLDDNRYLEREVAYLTEAFREFAVGVVTRLADYVGQLTALLQDHDETVTASNSLPESTLRMLALHVESVERCTLLVNSSQLPKSIGKLFQVLVDDVDHMLVAELERSAQAISMRAEPDLRSLSLLQQVAECFQLVDMHHQHQVAPLLTGASAVQHEAMLAKMATLANIAKTADVLLTRQIEAVCQRVAQLLSRQRREDFQPRSDDAASNRVTSTCMLVVSYLRQVQESLAQALPETSLGPGLTELGLQIFGLFLDHFQKFQISFAGALVLTKDLAQYSDVLSSWNSPVVTEKLALLRELSNLFVVTPDSLQTVLSEGILGRIRPELLQPYLAQREDW
ncbi:exocyst complex component Sec10-domain-containing protein, partial [Hyaloraphidium curvatum]